MSSYEHLVTQKELPHSRRRYLPLDISERRLLLTLGDLIALNAVLGLVLVGIGSASFSEAMSVWRYATWFALLNILWLVTSGVFDVYDLGRAASGYRSAWNAGGAAFIAGAFYWLIPFLPPSLPTRRIFVFALPLALALAIAFWRWLYARFLVQPQFSHNALIIGAGNSGQYLANVIAEQSQTSESERGDIGYRILGFVDDDQEKLGKHIAGVPVIGDRHELVRLVKELQPSELVVAITHLDRMAPDLFSALLDCNEIGVPITTMASLYERMTQRVPAEHAGRSLSVIMPIAPSASHRFYRVSKRFTDILIALVGCFVLAMIIPFVWLANRLTAPGDLFYRQERTGLHGKSFDVIKFRSMGMDAEKLSGAVWAVEDDPRITPVGHFLRKTRLDEFPQFWNVLKGDMSMVGPRPERPHFVAQLAEEFTYYRARHAVKPGITGWAQVKYRYGASVEDALAKLQYDLYYIKHQSIRLDIEIMLRTLQVMFGMHGR